MIPGELVESPVGDKRDDCCGVSHSRIIFWPEDQTNLLIARPSIRPSVSFRARTASSGSHSTSDQPLAHSTRSEARRGTGCHNAGRAEVASELAIARSSIGRQAKLTGRLVEAMRGDLVLHDGDGLDHLTRYLLEVIQHPAESPMLPVFHLDPV